MKNNVTRVNPPAASRIGKKLEQKMRMSSVGMKTAGKCQAAINMREKCAHFLNERVCKEV